MADAFEARDRSGGGDEGEILGVFPVFRPDDVYAAMDGARIAGESWAETDPAERARVLRRWRGRLWRSSTALATLLHRETGLSLDEAVLEILHTVEHLKWVEQNLGRVLAPTGRPRGLLTPELSSRTHYAPEGVVTVVASPQAPLYAPASAAAVALAAGNAVVVKAHPEATAILDAWAAEFPDERRVLQVITGAERTTDVVAAAPSDRLVVFGGHQEAARLAEIAARALVPVTTVPVGPPVVVVAPDADVRAAAEAVARSAARAESSPATAMPEVYVAPDVSAGFDVELRKVRAEQAEQRALGGGRLTRMLGGRARSVGPLALPAPVSVGAHIHADAEFGEVLERLSERPYAQVAVFSKRRGRRVADALKAAQVSINVGVSSPSLEGGLPREALGALGYGPLAGDPGLRTFTRAVTTTTKRRLPVPTTPTEALLATPGGRLAARLAMHLRHSLD